MKDEIPILSLIIALLAVFVGPLLSWLAARQQAAILLAVANKQITAPMRQAWINTLRDLTAELSSRALHYFQTGFEDRSDAEYQELTLLEQRIALMLNSEEADHLEFKQSIRGMIAWLERGKQPLGAFAEKHDETCVLAKRILKREWNRIKDPIKTDNLL